MSWIRSGGLLLLLLRASTARAWDHSSPSEIGRLLDAGEPVLVAFVQPDEPASAAFEPEWLSASASAGAGQHLLSVDCSDPETDCTITRDPVSYPAVFLLEADKPAAQYHGPRSAAAMLHFLSRRTRPGNGIPTNLTTEEALRAFRTEADETVFVAFLPEPTDWQAAAMFEDAALRYRDEFSFATVSDARVAGAQGLRPSVVLCYKPGDGDGDALRGPVQRFEELDKWIQEASVGVLPEMSALNRQRLLDRGLPMVYLFAATASERQNLRKSLYKFARKHRGDLTSVLVDPFAFPDLMAELGLDPAGLPGGAIHHVSKDRVYRFPKDKAFSADSVQSWISEVYEKHIGSHKPTTASEDARSSSAAAPRKPTDKAPGGEDVIGHEEL